MNRELKFRAFANGKMRYDVTGFEHGEANEMAVVFLDGEPHKIGDDCQVMQFTGLTDKNGKEIYEADVVDILFADRCEIVFHGGKFVGKYLDTNRVAYTNKLPVYGKVIGNIHEPVNPRVDE
jgi:uncharacterized phage protein (TIGR01671 family)